MVAGVLSIGGLEELLKREARKEFPKSQNDLFAAIHSIITHHFREQLPVSKYHRNRPICFGKMSRIQCAYIHDIGTLFKPAVALRAKNVWINAVTGHGNLLPPLPSVLENLNEHFNKWVSDRPQKFGKICSETLKEEAFDFCYMFCHYSSNEISSHLDTETFVRTIQAHIEREFPDTRRYTALHSIVTHHAKAHFPKAGPLAFKQIQAFRNGYFFDLKRFFDKGYKRAEAVFSRTIKDLRKQLPPLPTRDFLDHFNDWIDKQTLDGLVDLRTLQEQFRGFLFSFV
ncbi:MAG TPA: hypothetical protein VLE89_06915 [Chlamydiales bacterium]|nr:hypothetical protein [Chlamydiales bacterium]